MKPRVGIVVPGLALGGGVPAVARFLYSTALRDQRFEPVLTSLSTSADDGTNSNLRSPRSWRNHPTTASGNWESRPYVHVGAVAGELEFQRYRRRAALTRTLAGCDLLQVVSGFAAWANAVTGLGKPVALLVATRARVERRARGAGRRGAASWWRRGMTAITDRMDDRALRRVDAIQVMNPWMMVYARRINAGRKVDIRYAPPGVDARWFSPAPTRAGAANRYILCVGRHNDPRKNLGLLVEAFARLPYRIRTSARLVLAGSGNPPAAFFQQVDAAGIRDRVDLIDQPDANQLLQLYRHATSFALPSDEEGFGMVVIEAMACGTPVVATRCGGPEGIITDGRDGYLVPRNNAAAMAARLGQLMDDAALNAAMGAAARATVDQRYDEHITGQAFLDAWDRLLHGEARVRCAE